MLFLWFRCGLRVWILIGMQMFSADSGAGCMFLCVIIGIMFKIMFYISYATLIVWTCIMI